MEEAKVDLDGSMDPMDVKVKELLKEVQVDHSPSFTKLVDGTVSAIRDAIDKIPEGLQVRLLLLLLCCHSDSLN